MYRTPQGRARDIVHSTPWGNPIHPEIMDCPPLGAATQRTHAKRRSKSSPMSIIHTIARITLGIIFGVLGINGFVMFIPAPHSIPPLAAQFAGAMYVSHYGYLVFGVQVIAALLVLSNRYMTIALVALAAVIANIFAYHITMWPQAIFPMPVLALVAWFFTAWPIRAQFAPLFAKKVEAA